MDEYVATCSGCLALIALWAVFGLFIAWGIEQAWNLVLLPVFHWPRIDFAMACALYFLVSILAGLFRSSAKS